MDHVKIYLSVLDIGSSLFRKLVEITVRFSTLAKGPVNLITNSFCPLSRIKQPRLQTVNSPANGIIHGKSMRPHKTTVLLLNILGGGVENIMNFYEIS